MVKIKKIKQIKPKIKEVKELKNEESELEEKVEENDSRNFSEFIRGDSSLGETAPVITPSSARQPIGQREPSQSESNEENLASTRISYEFKTSRNNQSEGNEVYRPISIISQSPSEQIPRFSGVLRESESVRQNSLRFKNPELSQTRTLEDNKRYYEEKIEAEEFRLKRKLPFE